MAVGVARASYSFRQPAELDLAALSPHHRLSNRYDQVTVPSAATNLREEN